MERILPGKTFRLLLSIDKIKNLPANALNLGLKAGGGVHETEAERNKPAKQMEVAADGFRLGKPCPTILGGLTNHLSLLTNQVWLRFRRAAVSPPGPDELNRRWQH